MEAVGKFFRYLMKEGWISGGDMADYGARFLRFATSMFAGKKGPTPSSGAATNDSATRATHAGDHVDSFGKADDLGLMGLMTLFGVSDKPIKAEMTDEEIRGFGLFLEQLTDGEGAALLRIIGRGGKIPVTVKVTKEVSGENPGDPPRHVTHEYVIQATLPGIAIMRGIAKSLDAASKTNLAKRQTKAAQLATTMRKLDILDNLGDDMSAAWKWFTEKLPLELVSPATILRIHEATQRVGWRATYTILYSHGGLTLRRRITEANDEATREHWQAELRDFVLNEVVAQCYQAPRNQRRITWVGILAIASVAVLVIGLIIVPIFS